LWISASLAKLPIASAPGFSLTINVTSGWRHRRPCCLTRARSAARRRRWAFGSTF
jgi:hypothetical protein